METVFRDVQVSQIASRLGITKISVTSVLTEYFNYLIEKLENGKTIKILNICYLKVGGQEQKNHETLAYISNEIGKKVGVSQSVAFRILTSFEEYLIRDLQRMYKYSIRSLVRIRLEKNYKGEFKVRTNKSTRYNGRDIYVTTLGSFKRKVELVA